MVDPGNILRKPVSKLQTRALHILFVCMLCAPGIRAAGPTGGGTPEKGAGRHQLFSEVLRDHVRDGLVDYPAIRGDGRFWKYLDLVAATDPDTLATRAEKLAFWINAYNACTIQLIIDKLPLNSIRDIGLGLPVVSGPWSIEFAEIGGKKYTLNAIEHDIIRPRFKDPRIHFVLVCAAIGCPKLRSEAYEGVTLERQLDEETRMFLADTRRNRFEPGEKTVYLSKIFEWYEGDFAEAAGSVLKYIAGYVGKKEGAMLRDREVKIGFLEYDWSLNGRK